MKGQYECEHIVIVIRSFLKDISHLEIWVHVTMLRYTTTEMKANVRMWTHSPSHSAEDGSRSILDFADAKILDCNQCIAKVNLIYF